MSITCRVCLRTLPESSFPLTPTGRVSGTCSECRTVQNRRKSERHRERTRRAEYEPDPQPGGGARRVCTRCKRELKEGDFERGAAHCRRCHRLRREAFRHGQDDA